MARAAIAPQTIVKPCPVCGGDLPPVTVEIIFGAPERNEDGSMVLPVTARNATNMRVWKAAARLAHPRCGNGERTPDTLAA